MPTTSIPLRRNETAAVEITALAAGARPPANRIATRRMLILGAGGRDRVVIAQVLETRSPRGRRGVAIESGLWCWRTSKTTRCCTGPQRVSALLFTGSILSSHGAAWARPQPAGACGARG